MVDSPCEVRPDFSAGFSEFNEKIAKKQNTDSVETHLIREQTQRYRHSQLFLRRIKFCCKLKTEGIVDRVTSSWEILRSKHRRCISDGKRPSYNCTKRRCRHRYEATKSSNRKEDLDNLRLTTQGNNSRQITSAVVLISLRINARRPLTCSTD